MKLQVTITFPVGPETLEKVLETGETLTAYVRRTFYEDMPEGATLDAQEVIE